MSGINAVYVTDSITRGYGLVTPYPTQVATLLGYGAGLTTHNLGVDGRNAQDTIDAGASEVDVLYDGAASHNLLIALIGTNDRPVAGATTYAKLQTYWAARASAGFQIIACTVPNVTGYESTLGALNTLIRAGYLSDHCVGLADLAADSRLSDSTNATYFQADTLHPNDAGSAVIASIVAAAIATYLAPAQGGSTMSGRVYTVPISAVASPAAAFDLFEFNPASAKPIELIRIRLGQTSEPTTEEEQLRITVKRAQSTSGSGGSAPTPAPLNSTNTAAGFAAETMNTTVATGGSPITVFDDVMNIRAGYDMAFAPDECPEAVNGERLVVTCSAPADAVTFSGTAWVKERG